MNRDGRLGEERAVLIHLFFSVCWVVLAVILVRIGIIYIYNKHSFIVKQCKFETYF